MTSLNDILDGRPRAVVLEAMYLASHELTCSTRLVNVSAAQNRALDTDEAAEARRLADMIVSWFVDLEGKPVERFGDDDRHRLARKLSGYRRNHLTNFSDATREAAREALDRLSKNAA